MQTIDTEQFKNILLFKLKFSAWGNSRQGDMNQVETDADKERLSISKKLIVSPEYDAIRKHHRDLRTWCLAHAMPSMIDDGLYAVKPSMVPEFEAKLAESVDKQQDLVTAFLAVYQAAIADARLKLNGQFRAEDYPDNIEMQRKFAIGWRWTAFTVPEGLDPAIRDQEIAKLQGEMREATDTIISALRESFRDLVDKMVTKLSTQPGEKPKVIRKENVENLVEFINTFNARNVMNDTELQALVEKSKVIISDVTSDELRESAQIREWVAAKFKQVQGALDTMITTKATRKFDLE